MISPAEIPLNNHSNQKQKISSKDDQHRSHHPQGIRGGFDRFHRRKMGDVEATIRDVHEDIDKADGPKQVAVLLTAMGGDAVKLYYTFAFAPAVTEDEGHGIAAIPAQNKNSLADVLVKFDQHYGVKRFRNVRRQDSTTDDKKMGRASCRSYPTCSTR